MDARERASAAAFVASVILLGCSVVLPALDSPQSISRSGPEIPYDGVSYVINGYYIPTVNQGSVINVTLCCYEPGTIFFSLFPTKSSELAPTGPPIISTSGPTAPVFSAVTSASETSPYGAYVISYNGTTYNLKISSVWSPFYVLRVYTTPFAFLLIASGMAFYYFRETAARRRDEKKVNEELRRREAERDSP